MDEHNTDIHELGGKSPEFRTKLAKQLEDLVPEAIADGKVDVAKLKELLDEDAGDTNERFGLFWPGKKRAMRAAQDPTTATLKPAKDLSKDWDSTENIFIEGDNLEVLKVLQKQYHNAIKMIYIDPPYNTGKDFVYPDNFKEGLQNYLEFSKQVDAGGKKISTNAETAGRYHSNWLNMMYPRLKLARNLLTDDGVIFISIGDSEQDNLKKVCNEIFGEANFITTMPRLTSAQRPSQEAYVSITHDYVLVYARNKNFDFHHVIERNLSRLRTDANGDYLEGDTSPILASSTQGYSAGGDYDVEINGKTYSPVDQNGGRRRWLWTKERMDVAINLGIVVETKSTLRVKNYINKEFEVGSNKLVDKDPKLILTSNDLINAKYANNGGTTTLRQLGVDKYFDFPKPLTLSCLLLSLATDADSVILDFFSGSGTTAHAVMQLNAEDGGNRKHIQVQLPEPTDEKSEAYKAGYRKISDIARERINRAGEKIKADYADKLAERDTSLDVGYRTYKLSDTNFTKWKSEATNDLGELQMRLDAMRSSSDDNASEEDLLVEVMLKLGLPLTSRTIEREVSGLAVHQVVASADLDDSDTQPVFYLNEHIKPTLEQLRAIVTELTPSRFVILDDAFQGDNQLKTNLVQTCKSYDVESWTV